MRMRVLSPCAIPRVGGMRTVRRWGRAGSVQPGREALPETQLPGTFILNFPDSWREERYISIVETMRSMAFC